MTVPINIAIIYAGFLDFGGVETYLLSLFQRSDNIQFRWVIFASTSKEFSRKAKKYGIQVIPWTIAHVVDFKATLHLIRLLKIHRVALVHMHDPRAFIAGQTAAFILRLKTIYSVHIPLYEYVLGEGNLSKIKRFLYLQFSKRYIYRLATHLSFVSRRVYEETISRRLASGNKMSLIHNGVNLELFDSACSKERIRERMDLPINTQLICFVGRLDKQKGIDILLDAVRLLAITHTGFMVLIVGDGVERDFLQKEAKMGGIENRVSFLGFRNEVCEILKSVDVFVLPSRYEGMPFAILEAMAAGLPVIATDVGDNSFLIDDGITGFIVSPNDSVTLAEKLQILLDNPLLGKTMGKIAQQKVLLYNDARMVRKLETVYDSLLSNL